MILKSITTVLAIFIMIGVGLFVSHKKWVDRNISQAFPKMIVNLSLPAQILTTFNKDFTAEELSKSGVMILAPFIAMVLVYLLARLIAKAINIPKHRRGVFSVLFAFSNSVFIGFPVAQALFGDKGMPYATFFYVANTICFWTLGNFGIKRDGEILCDLVQKVNLWDIIKKVFNVPIIFVLLSVILVLLNIKLPEVIMMPAQYIGGLTTPLSMIFIGCVLYDIGLKNLRMERDIAVSMIGRFVVSGLVMIGISRLFHISGFVESVYLTQITLPAMTQTAMVSEMCNADADYAAKGMAWTTLVSLITIPVIATLFGGSV